MTSDHDRTDELLREARPMPALAWRHQLLRTLMTRPLPPPRPEHLWLLVTVVAGVGFVLLLIAALLV